MNKITMAIEYLFSIWPAIAAALVVMLLSERHSFRLAAARIASALYARTKGGVLDAKEFHFAVILELLGNPMLKALIPTNRALSAGEGDLI